MPGTDIAGPYGETLISTVTHAKKTPYDCLAGAGTWASATVKDDERDGIPDRLEAGGAVLDPPTVASPNGVPLPNLSAMGALPTQKDIFIEVNALWSNTNITHGSAWAPYDSGLGIDGIRGT